MIPFLPLLGWALGGFLGGLFVSWVIDYLDKRVLKKHIQEQKKQKFEEDLSKYIGGLLENEGYNDLDIGLNELHQRDYIKNDATTEAMVVTLMRRYGYSREILGDKTKYELAQMLARNGDDWYLNNISFTQNNNKSTMEIDWVLEDEESRRIFAGKYYNGEVVSMEEIQAEEIDPELQWELDNEEIVIL